MPWIKQHKLLFLILIVTIVAVVWYGISDSGTEPLLAVDAPIGGTLAEASADQEIVGSLLALRSVSLSATIFTDPAFIALKDFGTMLVPEAAGRPNPFAPIGSNGTATATTSGQSR